MKMPLRTIKYFAILLIVIFTVSACSPITIKDRTIWQYNMHNAGYCPVEGESRVIKFAASVNDTSGQVSRVWIRYRYVIPEEVSKPLNVDPTYGPYHEQNMMIDDMITTGGVGNYKLEVDAGNEILNETGFGPRILGVNIEYRFYVENKNHDIETLTKTMIFCYH
jgi:hypothetical protein